VYLPSYIDDVLEYANLAAFPATGESNKIYIATDTNLTYRWGGSIYVLISSGVVQSVNGYTGIINITKSDVDLGNVDNTSDLNKPISTATQTALDSKSDISHTHNYVTSVNTKTGSVTLVPSDIGAISSSEKGSINGVTPLDATGKVDSSYLPTFTSDVTSVNGQTGAVVLTKSDIGLANVDNTSDLNKPISTATQTALDSKVTSVNGQTGIVVLTKSDIGLANVDNTSDLNKPISTATQTALDGKATSSHTHGDILNDGTITSANVAPASGDYILISDSSNSSKIQKSIAIGVDTTTYLRNDGTWQTVSGGGGVTVSDDISTNATYYPTFSTITSGTLSAEKVSSTKLTYNPSTGALTATKFTSLSDAKLKTNITDIKGLDAVSKMRGVEFDWIDGSGHTAGVIAQELEEVLPFLVDKSMIDETKSVNYIGIIAYLIESVKELKTEIELIKKGIQ
jgi:hypothetical protein